MCSKLLTPIILIAPLLYTRIRAEYPSAKARLNLTAACVSKELLASNACARITFVNFFKEILSTSRIEKLLFIMAIEKSSRDGVNMPVYGFKKLHRLDATHTNS
jgi:hypothetical protein